MSEPTPLARVLVVDDVQSMCEMLAERLPPLGFDVEWRTSAAEALAYLTTHDVDAVVTDINMREMDGLELCDRIVTAHPEVPVIVITAFGNLDTAVKAVEGGAFEYLTKPFDLSQALDAVSRALQRQPAEADEPDPEPVEGREQAAAGEFVGHKIGRAHV